MLFQTPEFLILMSAVLVGIATMRLLTGQHVLLLIASYVFYGWWDWRFLVLIWISTVNDFVAGIGIERSRSPRTRRAWLFMSLATNLGLLGFFKYYNFFADSMARALSTFGIDTSLTALNIVLPVGISFYTFQTLSYTIDVYRGQLKSERSLLRFAVFVAFFPQLVAGPILRARDFLPQLRAPIDLDAGKFRSGIHLFLVGLFKKVLIADQIAPLVNNIFAEPAGLPSTAIWIGTIAFGIQIYCDFSGYTDMARGAGRMLNFDICENFRFPYFASSITEFWRRWHMSLSGWLRDYLYVSLGGNRHGALRTYRNLLLTMGLGGLWHGAGWNFVIWGLYQGGLLAVERVLGISASVKAQGAESSRGVHRTSRVLIVIAGWLVCQYFVFLGWLIFRVHELDPLLYCMQKFVLFDFDFRLGSLGLGGSNPFLAGMMVLLFIVLHAASRVVGGAADWLDRQRPSRRWPIYLVVITLMFFLWPTHSVDFIYFQF